MVGWILRKGKILAASSNQTGNLIISRFGLMQVEKSYWTVKSIVAFIY